MIAERRLFGPVQRSARTVSFAPFSRRATRALSQVSDETLGILGDPAAGDVATGDFHRATASTLANGAELDRLLLDTVQVKVGFVNDLVARASDGPAEADLVGWVRHVVTMAATTGMYGEMNPYNDPKHEENFWWVPRLHEPPPSCDAALNSVFRVYHDKIQWIVSGLAGIFAPRAAKAREEMGKNYETYFQAGGSETASGFIKERSRILRDNGAPARDIARINVGNDAAIISNYVPTSFWVAFNILSRPQLLAAIREEVARAVTRGGEDGNDFTLDISVLRTGCPLILSTLQETQRLCTAAANIREVVSDTTISAGGRQYVLKKGNYVQLANMPVLRSAETWGADAGEFDPYRFIKMRKDKDSAGVVAPGQLPSHSFPVWGVAPHLCPARWYASTGVISLVALMVLRLDVSPARPWKKPRVEVGFSTIEQPGEAVPVSVRAREEYKGAWAVTVGTPDTRIQLSAA